jgi:imidazolonepropionase-like amidohydrolase
MRRDLAVAIGLAASLAAACTPSESGPPQIVEDAPVLLFEGARVILGDGDLIENGAFLVQGDRIVALGRAGEVTTSPGATIIDLSGTTVIPAMIDVHTHLGYEAYTSWGADNYTRENVIEHLERYAYYGFGAVFSAGSDPHDLALDIQRAQQQGDVGGARFLFAAGMAPPDQGPNAQFVGHALTLAEQTGMTVLTGVTSAEEGRSAVREVAREGIRFIKIWVDDRGGSQEKLGRDVYRAIVDEARVRAIDVFVHQQNALDMPDLLEAGVSGFLHGRIGAATDDLLSAQIRDAGAFLVPNLGLGELRRERLGDDRFLLETTTAEVADRLNEAYDARTRARGGVISGRAAAEAALRRGFQRLLSANVRIVLGTDAGALPGHFFGYTGHRELEIFVRIGMTPMQAIVAATGRAAAGLGLSDMGTLAPGNSADFVILDANPLDDIRNTRTISRVYLRGREVDREGLRARWTGGG